MEVRDMNSKTKIVVIRRRELLIGAVIGAAVIVFIIFLIASLLTKSSQTSVSRTTGSKSISSAAKTINTYTPGVYSASINLNGNPIDIQVTVDKDNINSIDILNVSDDVTTMYPMLQSSFEELANAVIENGSTQNITYSADNKYTSTMLLNAIQSALDKCTVK
jgi:uncharacterized protein with FMN-binding domain